MIHIHTTPHHTTTTRPERPHKKDSSVLLEAVSQQQPPSPHRGVPLPPRPTRGTRIVRAEKRARGGGKVCVCDYAACSTEHEEGNGRGVARSYVSSDIWGLGEKMVVAFLLMEYVRLSIYIYI